MRALASESSASPCADSEARDPLSVLMRRPDLPASAATQTALETDALEVVDRVDQLLDHQLRIARDGDGVTRPLPGII